MSRIIRRVNKQFDPNAFMKAARHRAAPGNNVAQKMDESLYFIHQIKNSTTVKTGEFEALTRLYTGQKMYVDTRDISLAPHLMLDGIWEEGFSRTLRKYLTSDSVFFDVGANFGYFGLIAGTEVTDAGSIHFFEPNPLLANYIKRTVAINGLWKRSHVVQKAVGASNTQLKLTVPGDYFGSASVVIDDQEISRYVESSELKSFNVEQVTIDQYVKDAKLDKVDVMKIDVEGFEEHVYGGMAKTIKNNPNLIVFLEFTQNSYENPKAFFAKIQKDFAHIYLCEDGLRPIENMAGLEETVNRDGFAMIAFSNQML